MELGCNVLMMKNGSISFAGNTKDVMTERTYPVFTEKT
jgi:hypothetical protein